MAAKGIWEERCMYRARGVEDGITLAKTEKGRGL